MTRKARVLFFTHYSKMYGANRSLLDLVGGLDSDGHEVAVVVPERGPVVRELELAGVPWQACPFRQWLAGDRWRSPFRVSVNLFVLPLLTRIVHRWDPDIIHTNSSVIPVGAWVAKITSTPHVWHVREFGDLDYGLTPDLGESVFQFWLGEADALIPVSHAVRKEVLRRVEGVCRVIYNGVVTRRQAEKFRMEEYGAAANGPYTYAIVGLLSPAKGQDVAIKAMHRLTRGGDREQNAQLVIAGSGAPEYTKHLKRLAARLGVDDRTTFLGYVDDPFEVYRRADALIMASKHEAMGRVTAEAMIAALPVIGRDSGGTPELVRNEETGLLFEGGPAELAEAMRRLASKPEWGRHLGRNGWNIASREFTVERYVDKVESVYDQVL